jgi:plasmid maintenance system killer protein
LVADLRAEAAQNFEGKKSNLRKINELKVRKQYRTVISNRFFSFGELK